MSLPGRCYNGSMKFTLKKRQTETPTAETFFWQPEEPLTLVAGQYLEYHLAHNNPDDRGEIRWFTNSASPTEEFVRITTRHLQPDSTFKHALFAMNVGEQIEAVNPEGDFVLPDDLGTPLVFVAGGIGITPFRSILKFCYDQGQTPPIQLIYAAKTADEFAFKAELESWGIKPIYVVTNDEGNLDGQKIIDLAGGLDGKLAYLSGPEPMVKAFRDQLKELGIAADSIKIDDFPGYVD